MTKVHDAQVDLGSEPQHLCDPRDGETKTGRASELVVS